ncbi:MAG: hypothetical protein NTY19_17550 [Planctomycetota bacterium]|nr:hypothetical protein [Planctomycetota bacterium]
MRLQPITIAVSPRSARRRISSRRVPRPTSLRSIHSGLESSTIRKRTHGETGAGAVKQIQDGPALTFFLGRHRVADAKTPQAYAWTSLYGAGLLEKANGEKQKYLVRISGGLQIKPEIVLLDVGDVTPLRKLVLGSRPRLDTACWDLPLQIWDPTLRQKLALIVTLRNASSRWNVGHVRNVTIKAQELLRNRPTGAALRWSAPEE